jgi:hypothetical protein
MMFIVGGYGWKADSSDMITFNTIIAFNVTKMVTAIKNGSSASDIKKLIRMAQDDRLAVTGGELFYMNNVFFLVFGQVFTGQYRAFGGTDYTQTYTESIKRFTLNPNTLQVLSYGETTTTNPDRPYHRRDGNIIQDIDPQTFSSRIGAYGGVFRPGIIGAYTYPVFINSTDPSNPVIDTSGNQKFSQYECPVVSIVDSSAKAAVYHTFFGGIGHYYYAQTPSQKAIYDTATVQGRNDGFPFVQDITTFLQKADGTYEEWIHTTSTPNHRLVGSSVRFLLMPKLINEGVAYSNGVIKLQKLTTGQKQFVGYVYGGIEALNPLPFIPNTGTWVTNSVWKVYVTRQPTAAIPASEGHQSTQDYVNLPYLDQ